MKEDYKMDYNNPMKSGRTAYLRGHKLEDNPCIYRTSASARELWNQGWQKEQTMKNSLRVHCRECKHWTVTKDTAHHLPEYQSGTCIEIINHLDIEVKAGPNGGYVESIETEPSFGCSEGES